MTSDPERNKQTVKEFHALMFNECKPRDAVERFGKPIGPLDTLIASQAVARKLALVSNNRKEFGRVPGLDIGSGARL